MAAKIEKQKRLCDKTKRNKRFLVAVIAKQTNERRHMVEKNLRNARPRICRCMSEFPQGKHRTKCTAQFEQKEDRNCSLVQTSTNKLLFETKRKAPIKN